MPERAKAKASPAAASVGRQIKELEARLAQLEAMLAEVRAEAGRSSGRGSHPAGAMWPRRWPSGSPPRGPRSASP